MSFVRIVVFDFVSIVSLTAIMLAIFLPIVALIELIQLARKARTASWRAIAMRSRERVNALRLVPTRASLPLEFARRMVKVTPESSKAA